jgi:hypothetical protein
MVSVLALTAIDHGFEPQSGQTKDYKIGICCFSAKYAAIKRKSKDWMVKASTLTITPTMQFEQK